MTFETRSCSIPVESGKTSDDGVVLKLHPPILIIRLIEPCTRTSFRLGNLTGSPVASQIDRLNQIAYGSTGILQHLENVQHRAAALLCLLKTKK
jgi:hypothetical protein